MKRRKIFVLIATLLVIFLLSTGSAFAQDSGRDDRDSGDSGGSSSDGGSSSGGNNNNGGGGNNNNNNSGGDSGSSSDSSSSSGDSGGSSSSSGDSGSGGSSSSSGDNGSGGGNPDGSPNTDNPNTDPNTQPASDGQSTAPNFVPPLLPGDGCHATTAVNGRVWARTQPSETAPEHGHLNPGRVYEALALVPGDGGLWVELVDFERGEGVVGYAAGSVVETAGCPVEDLLLADRGEVPPLNIQGVVVFSLLYLGDIDPANPTELISPDGSPIAIDLPDVMVKSWSVSGSGQSDGGSATVQAINIGSITGGGGGGKPTFNQDDEPGLEGVTIYLDLNINGNAASELGFVILPPTAFGDLGNDWLVGGTGQDSQATLPLFLVVASNIGDVDGTDLLIVNNGDGSDFFEFDQIGRLIVQVDAGEFGGMNGIVFSITGPPIPADDGVVDALDYTIWRDNLGGSSASGDGLVDAADYTVWRDNMGTPASASGGDYDVWRENFGASLPPAANAQTGTYLKIELTDVQVSK